MSISNKRWRRYIPGLNINNANLDCNDDVKKWLPSLIKIETSLLLALGLDYEIEGYAKKRFFTYGYVDQEAGNAKITHFLNCEPEKQDAANATSYILPIEEYSNKNYYRITSPVLRMEAGRDLEKLTNVINGILSTPINWSIIL